MRDFTYQDILPIGEDKTKYRKLTGDFVSTVDYDGVSFLKVDPKALSLLASEAMKDIANLLRPGHLAQLAAIH